jgi:hypothetical protein
MEKRKFKRRRWHEPFFSNLEKYGSVSGAALLTGIGRATVYRELEHEAFQRQFGEAMQAHRDGLLLKLTGLAMGGTREDPVPKHVSLAALQFLVNRADRRLERQDEQAGQIGDEPAKPKVLTIEVSAENAEKLFQNQWPTFPYSHGSGSGKPN